MVRVGVDELDCVAWADNELESDRAIVMDAVRSSVAVSETVSEMACVVERVSET